LLGVNYDLLTASNLWHQVLTLYPKT